MDDINPEYFASLLRKLKTNQSLTKDDFQYLYKFLENHENCSLALAFNENCDEEIEYDGIEQNISKKDSKSVGVQCDLHHFEDYRKLESLICKQWRLPPEERNANIIDEIFRRLFVHRRPIMKREGLSVKLVKSLYPYLFAREQIFSELELIKGRDNLFKEFMINVESFSYAIHHFTSRSPFDKEKLKLNSLGENLQQMFNAASLVLLPRFMEENRKGIIVFNGETYVGKEDVPYIYAASGAVKSLEGNSICTIYLGNHELCTLNSIEQAYFGLVAAYAAFNINYPENLCNTFAILEKLYFKFDSPQIPANSQEIVESKQKSLENFINNTE